jgi:hypothetical protein
MVYKSRKLKIFRVLCYDNNNNNHIKKEKLLNKTCVIRSPKVQILFSAF